MKEFDELNKGFINLKTAVNWRSWWIGISAMIVIWILLSCLTSIKWFAILIIAFLTGLVIRDWIYLVLAVKIELKRAKYLYKLEKIKTKSQEKGR